MSEHQCHSRSVSQSLQDEIDFSSHGYPKGDPVRIICTPGHIDGTVYKNHPNFQGNWLQKLLHWLRSNAD